MPPKKKVAKKKKKAASSDATLDEKYKQTLFEIGSLKDHLALRTEVSRRAQASAATMRSKLVETEEAVLCEKLSKQELVSEVTRQHNSTRSELLLQIDFLQQRVSYLEEKLASTEQQLDNEKREKATMQQEKDDKITELELTIEHLESAFENIIHDTFDELQEQVDAAQNRRCIETSHWDEEHKRVLVEYGLDPLLL